MSILVKATQFRALGWMSKRPNLPTPGAPRMLWFALKGNAPQSPEKSKSRRQRIDNGRHAIDTVRLRRRRSAGNQPSELQDVRTRDLPPGPVTACAIIGRPYPVSVEHGTVRRERMLGTRGVAPATLCQSPPKFKRFKSIDRGRHGHSDPDTPC